MREKGGSLITFWRAKTTRSRKFLLTRYPPSSSTKKRRKRSGETSSETAFAYKPARAFSRRASLRSVAKIWSLGAASVSVATSAKVMASE